MGFNSDGSYTPTGDDPIVQSLLANVPLSQRSALEVDDRAEYRYHNDVEFHAKVERAVQVALSALERRRLYPVDHAQEVAERAAMRRAVAVALVMEEH